MKACPFCGSDDVVVMVVGKTTRRRGECGNCYATAASAPTHAEAVKNWDRRKAEYLDAQWQPMATAPEDGRWCLVKLPNGCTEQAHYAYDLTGEDQPPFQGWFKKGQGCMIGIDNPVAWYPLPPN